MKPILETLSELGYKNELERLERNLDEAHGALAETIRQANIEMDRHAQEIAAYRRLFDAVDAMMAYLGMHGEISPKSELADAVMNCMHEIDPK